MISPSFENFFVYNALEFDIISHVLTLGYAVMLAALFYFVMTIRTVAPRFRTSSVLSVVVMVSAALILFNQQQSWENGFIFVDESAEFAALGEDGAEEAGVVIDVDALNNADSVDDLLGTYVPVRAFEGASAENPFTNGFRYLNWLIDVPMLLFQILFVVEITRDRRASIRNWFFFSGTGMIVTGYIGQFYEYTNGAGPEGPFWIWGAISTAFFFHVLFLMYQVITDARSNLSEGPSRVMGQIGILFFISWMLYPGAYLMPALLDNVSGVVGRQLTFTVADVSSKVIYGIMLTYVAQLRSDEEGYMQPDSDLLEGPKPAAGD
jgi:hypothetical protein